MKKIYYFLLLTLATVFLVSCDANDKTFNVKIYVNGEEQTSIKVDAGSTLTEEQLNSVEVSEDFIYWAIDANGTRYTFGVGVYGDFELYAITDSNNIEVTYDVKINVSGEVKKTIKVVENEKVSKQSLDSLKPANFKYWSTSANGSEYNFDTLVTSDITLYAVVESTNGGGSDIDINIDWSKYGSYYQGFGLENVLDQKLKDGLKTRLYQGAKISTYSGSFWSTLKKADIHPDNPGKVWLIYDGVLRGVGESGGNQGQWNKEHVIPQSWLKDIGKTNMTGDQHNLRASDVKLNSDRGNKSFMDKTTDAKSSYINGSAFYPGDDHRGDVARIIMYMLIMHPELNINKVITGGKFYDVLLKWHLADPVDAFEIRRNSMVYEDQGNRNPFIDYPGLIYHVWNSQYGFPTK